RSTRDWSSDVCSSDLPWTEAQRGDPRNYHAGLTVQFHQNVLGFRRGERIAVTGQGEDRRVLVKRQNDETAILPLDKSGRFQVYRSEERRVGTECNSRC